MGDEIDITGIYSLDDQGDGSPVRSVDPVCGTIVDESQAAGKAKYAGQTYYFCSNECKKDFEETPVTFVGIPR
jgi:YHS domain-containing protein